MFHFCLVNEHKVKEQIASFPSIFLARKNICFIKARHFRERVNPPGGDGGGGWGGGDGRWYEDARHSITDTGRI